MIRAQDFEAERYKTKGYFIISLVSVLFCLYNLYFQEEEKADKDLLRERESSQSSLPVSEVRKRRE